MLTACHKVQMLSAITYAQIETIDDKKIVLDLGTWQDEIFTANTGETVIRSSEVVWVQNQQGKELRYNDLQPGDIVQVNLQTDVSTNKSTVSIVQVEP